MPYFIIKYDAGYGEEIDVLDAEDLDDAKNMAYEAWLEAVENNADYDAIELNKDTAEEYDIDLNEYAD